MYDNLLVFFFLHYGSVFFGGKSRTTVFFWRENPYYCLFWWKNACHFFFWREKSYHSLFLAGKGVLLFFFLAGKCGKKVVPLSFLAGKKSYHKGLSKVRCCYRLCGVNSMASTVRFSPLHQHHRHYHHH